jgi:hypothetical protein
MRKEFNGADRFFPITYKDAWKVVREIANALILLVPARCRIASRGSRRNWVEGQSS